MRESIAKRPLCVTSVAKVLKEGFYLIIKQALLRPAEADCGHEASPCNGIAASRERRSNYAASETVKAQAGSAKCGPHGIIREAA